MSEFLLNTSLSSSDFIRQVRLKNNISDLKASYRLNVSLSEYIQMESAPHKLALLKLSKLLSAIECSPKELIRLQSIVIRERALQMNNISKMVIEKKKASNDDRQ